MRYFVRIEHVVCFEDEFDAENEDQAIEQAEHRFSHYAVGDSERWDLMEIAQVEVKDESP